MRLRRMSLWFCRRQSFPGVRLLLFASLALFVAPQIGGTLFQAGSERAASTTRRTLRVRDARLASEIERKGGRLLADYQSYRLYEVDDAVAAEAARGGKIELLDEYRYVLLNAGAIDTRSLEARVETTSAAEPLEGKRTHLVQLVGPTRPDWYRAIQDTGVEVVSYLPHNAYLVYGDEASVEALRDLARSARFVQWEGPYLNTHKIQPRARARIRSRERRGADTDLYAIQLVRDPAVNSATLQLVNRLRRGAIQSQFDVLNYRNLIVAVDTASLETLASRPDVVSIQPYVIPEKSGERQSLIVAGNFAGDTPGAGYLAFLASKGFTQQQFTASGFAVDVSDSGIDNGTPSPNHFGLYAGGNMTGASRVVYNRLEGLLGGNIEGCDGHGTINAHIVAGYNDLSGFPHTDLDGFHYGLGVAPFVRVGSSVIFGPSYTYPNFPDLHSRAYEDGARISTNSWGALGNGVYDAQAQTFDALTRDAQPTGSAFAAPGNQQMVMVVASGNEGAAAVRSPGTAKNVITVGATENVHPFGGADGCGVDDTGADSAEDIAYFSSTGPTEDQRTKPDLVAPGSHVSGGVFQTTTPGPNGEADPCYDGSATCGGVGNIFFPSGQEFYTASTGTSHSTPAVAGGTALVRQYFINQSLSPPSPAMTKAFLMSSARYLTGAGADDDLWSNNQGMGGMDLGFAFDGSARILRDQVPEEMFTASGQTRAVTGTIADPGQPFRVTLAWTDAPGSTTGVAFNNDLDLTVTLGGVTYKGNVFSGAHSVAGGSADLRNNVESVFLPAGATGDFAVTVTASNINSDGVPNVGGALDQDFALVIYNGVEIDLPVIVSAGATLTAESCGAGNGAVDPGEAVTVDMALANVGHLDAVDVIATLQATGGVSSPSGPQSYGGLVAGGPAVSRSFSFTAQGSCGGVVTATLDLQDGGTDLGTVSFEFDLGTLEPGGEPTSFSNPSTIFIDVGGPAIPYPSDIVVSGLPGTVTKVTATLNGVNHVYPDDIDVLLVAPDGESVVLMSDSGNGTNTQGAILTFDDDAASSLPDGGPLVSGTYRPTNWEGASDDFSPGPGGPYGSVMADLNGGDPNGTWKLYVTDDFFVDGGSIANGWSLTITTSTPVCCTGGPAVVVSPTSGLTTTEAGGTATFSVALNTLPTDDVVIGLSSSDTSEGTVSPSALTFTPIDALTEQTVTVTGVDDDLQDGEVAYSIVTAPAVSTDPNYDGLDPSDVSVVNADDEPVEIVIGDVAVTEGDAGTVDAAFNVTLSAATSGPVTVDFTTVDGTAAAGNDYVAASGTLSLPAGTTAATIAVTVNGDTLAEADETFFVNLSSATGATIGDGQGLGTILNDDPPPTITIDDVVVAEGDSGTTGATFTVSLSAPSSQTITVDYATADGSAAAGSDYLAASGTLSFSPSSISNTVSVSVIGDTDYESQETFFVNLSGATGATLGDAQGQGTIIDDDPLSGAEAVVWTNDVGVLVSGNSLSKTAPTGWNNAGAVSTQAIPSGDGFVEFTASETNTYRMLGLGRDDVSPNYDDIEFAVFLFADGSLQVYESGFYRGTFGTYTTGDRLRVAVESGVVVYSQNGSVFYTSGVAPSYPLLVDTALYTNGATLSDAFIFGSGPPEPTVTIDDVVVMEGDSGTTEATFTVSLSAPSSQTITVDYATADGSAVAGSDYLAASGTLSFSPSSVSETVLVSVIGDTDYEPQETFFVNLSGPVGATLEDGQGQGMIVDDEPPSGAEAVVWTDDVGVIVSGNSLTKTAPTGWNNAGAVSTQAIPSGDGYVEFIASETNTYRMLGLGGDNVSPNYDDIEFAIFLYADGSLQVYESGAYRGIFGTYNAGDRLRVAVESGVVVYSQNGSVFYTSSVAPSYPLLVDTALYSNGATLNNAFIFGSSLPAPTLTIDDVMVTEGDSGTTEATFTVSLSAPSSQTITVDYATADGSAVAGSDYLAASGTLSFSPSSVSETVSVSVIGDTDYEPEETFFVNLSGAIGATLGDGQGQGTIANDDPAAGAEAVVWTEDVGVIVSGNNLTKTAPTGWANAGAVSTQAIPSGDGYVEFTASETNTYRMAGLSRGNVGANYDDIDFAIFLYADGSLQVYESGAYRGTFGSYAVGDRLRVAVQSGVVVYSQNDSVFYTSGEAPFYPLLADTALYSNGATLSDAVIFGSGPPPPTEDVVWTNDVGVAVSSNNLTKTAPTGWANAGAASTQEIPSGDGFVEFTASETNTYRMLGLSSDDATPNYDDIDFAIFLYAGGSLQVYEGGAYRGSFGTYSTGDRLQVAVQSGVVFYSRNGTVFYVSSVAPSYPLLVDTALYTNGATLNNAVISGTVP